MAETNNQTNGSRNNGTQRKSVRGFAAMDQEKQREIARKGGRAAHEQGVAHEWSSHEAREAGKKGGQARGRQNTKESTSE
jgi:general stress protein YciG